MNTTSSVTGDLFSDLPSGNGDVVQLAEGAVLLRGIAERDGEALMKSLEEILSVAPFRHMITPGGYRMSVQDRIEALREKHASLERALDEEIHRPLPDQDAVHDLKRQKLRIKDELSQLEKQ